MQLDPSPRLAQQPAGPCNPLVGRRERRQLLFPLPRRAEAAQALACVFLGGRPCGTGSLSPHLHSCHLLQPPPPWRAETRLASPTQKRPMAFPSFVMMVMVRVKGSSGQEGGRSQHGPPRAAWQPAGAEVVLVLIAVNECHQQKEKQKLPPKIPEQNLAKLLKTPISKG